MGADRYRYSGTAAVHGGGEGILEIGLALGLGLAEVARYWPLFIFTCVGRHFTASKTPRSRRTRRCSQPEPAGWPRHESNVTGGWLRWLTFAFGNMTRAQEELRRATLRLTGLLGVLTAIATLFDFGRYGEEFRQYGLLGFLGLPSLLVFQIGYLLAAALLLIMARPIGQGLVFRTVPLVFAVAVVVYGFGLFLLFQASRAGEFGIGAAAVAVLLFWLPSAALLLLGLPLFIIYAIRRSIAEPGAPADGSQPVS